MTKLATLHAEAFRKLARRERAAAHAPGVQGRRAERRWQRLTDSLVPLCEAYWAEIRGPRPDAALAQAVWEVAPPLADLFVHLHGSGDARLAEMLGRCTPAQALGLLVEVEIGRGNPEGARLAYEAMMLFDSPGARAAHTRSVMTRFAHRDEPKTAGRHARRPALWRALAAIVAATGRYDLAAVLASARLLAQAQSAAAEGGGDPRLRSLLATLSTLGVRFDALDSGRLRYSLRGVQKAPIAVKRVATLLADLRREHGL